LRRRPGSTRCLTISKSPRRVWTRRQAPREALELACHIADNAGNAEAPQTVSVQIDTTPPTVSDNAPAGWSASAVTVTLNAGAQDQPLVTLFNRQAGVVTISNLDPTQWAAVLTAGAKVRVFGVPDGSGNLKAYYVNIYQ